MNQKIKGFLLGIIVMMFVTNNIYAREAISVVINSINLRVNGQEVGKVGQNYNLSNGDTVPYSMIYKNKR